jgi:hypothetical protein
MEPPVKDRLAWLSTREPWLPGQLSKAELRVILVLP